MYLKTGNAVGHFTFSIIHEHKMFHCCKGGEQRLNEREDGCVDENDFIFSMIDDVSQLFGEQSNIQRMQNTPTTRRSKIQLEMALRVPCKSGDATIGRYPQCVEY